jgi:hypothetical protein
MHDIVILKYINIKIYIKYLKIWRLFQKVDIEQ